MSYEECMELINAIIHATELCAMLEANSEEYATAANMRDELAEYAGGLMAWGLQGRMRRAEM